MRWTLILKGVNHFGAFTDTLYYDTREEARYAKRFYKTMCEPALDSVRLVDLGAR